MSKDKNTELPAPMIAPEIDLQDFAFMPLDVLRLRDSELAGAPNAEVFRCSVLSWCVSWHQIPAASLPDDDTQLARLLGFGRDTKGWKKIREAGGLHGWVRCVDGRLYHPVVAEKAVEAWNAKLAQRWRSEVSRIKKHCQRHKVTVNVPDFESWLSQGCPQGQPLPVPEDKPTEDSGQGGDVPKENHSKGQGEGQGQGQGDLVKENKPPSAASMLAEFGVPDSVAGDFIKLRKTRRAPITKTVVDGIREESEKAGIPFAEAVRICCVRGWQSFKASWDWQSDYKPSGKTNGSDRKHDDRKQFLDALTGGSSSTRTIDGTASQVDSGGVQAHEPALRESVSGQVASGER